MPVIGRTPEIDDLQSVSSRLLEHHIFWLQVAVDQALRVKSDQTFKNLARVLSHIVELESLLGVGDEFIQRLVEDLEDNAELVLVHKVVLHLDQVLSLEVEYVGVADKLVEHLDLDESLVDVVHVLLDNFDGVMGLLLGVEAPGDLSECSLSDLHEYMIFVAFWRHDKFFLLLWLWLLLLHWLAFDKHWNTLVIEWHDLLLGDLHRPYLNWLLWWLGKQISVVRDDSEELLLILEQLGLHLVQMVKILVDFHDPLFEMRLLLLKHPKLLSELKVMLWNCIMWDFLASELSCHLLLDRHHVHQYLLAVEEAHLKLVIELGQIRLLLVNLPLNFVLGRNSEICIWLEILLAGCDRAELAGVDPGRHSGYLLALDDRDGRLSVGHLPALHLRVVLVARSTSSK